MQVRYIARGLLSATVALAISACAPRHVKSTIAGSSVKQATTAEVEPMSQPRALAGGNFARTPSPREVFRNGQMVVGDEMNIYTMPVGAGNCQFMECPSQNKLIVFDCGSRGLGSLGWTRPELKAFVGHLVDTKTDVVVSISHADRDHSNYLPEVFGDIQVSSILFAQQQQDYPVQVSRWMEKQKAGGASLVRFPKPFRSDRPMDDLSCWAPDGKKGWVMNVPGYILGVNAGTTANDASMVIAQTYDFFQTVFTGDMTGQTEAFIFKDLKVDLSETDVITGAHHGADTMGSNSTSWAKANEAEVVIFSAGTRDTHPRCVSVDVYRPYLFTNASQHEYDCGSQGFYFTRKTKEAVLVTDTQGLITVSTDGDEFTYTSNPNARPDVGQAEEREPKPRAPTSSIEPR